MRTSLTAVLAALTLAACGGDVEPMDDPAADPGAMAADPDLAPAGEATGLPPGYELRLDRDNTNPADFQVSTADGALRIQTGPHGVLYRAEDAVADGDYSVSATFTEVGAPPGHREGYGLLFGGADLQGEGQTYSYFLVRGDGSYLIKRRSGADTPNVSDGWVSSDAVQAATEQGDVTNTLEVAVHGDQVHFSVNGTEVAVLPAAEVDTHGITGVRLSHNLDVRVADFSVAR